MVAVDVWRGTMTVKQIIRDLRNKGMVIDKDEVRRLKYYKAWSVSAQSNSAGVDEAVIGTYCELVQYCRRFLKPAIKSRGTYMAHSVYVLQEPISEPPTAEEVERVAAENAEAAAAARAEGKTKAPKRRRRVATCASSSPPRTCSSTPSSTAASLRSSAATTCTGLSLRSTTCSSWALSILPSASMRLPTR